MNKYKYANSFWAIIKRKFKLTDGEIHNYWLDFCDEVLEPIGYMSILASVFCYRFNFYQYIEKKQEEKNNEK